MAININVTSPNGVTLATSGKYCEQDVKVTPLVETKNAEPKTTEQNIEVSDGKVGMTNVHIDAVTSSIDSNIKAENIKKDVKILGVTGSFEGGGERDEVEAKDVNFIDYDGKILYSYTVDEMMKLTELPPNPSHKGLVAQGWNWTLEDLKSYGVRNTVGQMYSTEDGATHIGICIAEHERVAFPLSFNQSTAYGVLVDWGDGSAKESFGNTGRISVTHKYNKIGNFVIKLKCINGSLAFDSYVVTNGNQYYNNVYSNMLSFVHISEDVTSIAKNVFYNCSSLRSITIPNSVISIYGEAFRFCYQLSSVTIPSGVNRISVSTFYNCFSLRRVSLPNSVTDIEDYSFNSNNFLSSITIPSSVKTIPTYVFNGCISLSTATIPDGVTTIKSGAFSACRSLTAMTIPNSVTSIGNNAFNNTSGLRYINFKGTTPPAIGDARVFASTPSDFTIYVPDESVSAYKTATNWTTYASMIQPVSKMPQF